MTAPTLEVRVRKSARALSGARTCPCLRPRERANRHGRLYVCAAQPMGLIAPGTPGTVVRIDGDLPDGVLGEVRIHREIYRRRPEIHGVARTMPPKIMSLSTLRITPKARHGFGSYFYPAIPLWDHPLLIQRFGV